MPMLYLMPSKNAPRGMGSIAQMRKNENARATTYALIMPGNLCEIF